MIKNLQQLYYVSLYVFICYNGSCCNKRAVPIPPANMAGVARKEWKENSAIPDTPWPLE